MPMYARGAGLIDLGSYKLTPFGHDVVRHDPNIMRMETLWLMHYYLSAPHGPGPTFWSALVCSVVRIGQSLRRADISAAITKHLQDSAQKTLTSRTVDSTATAFLGSYAKSDALGRLGVLEAREDGQGLYEVRQPEAPPVWVIGSALCDYWDAVSNGASELLMKDLGRQDGFAGVFFMGPGMLGTFLSELQTAGVLAIKRDAPPFVVTRLWQDPAELRKCLYA